MEWNGNTALIEASEKGYTEIVKLLLKAGADVNAEDGDGRTALILAKEQGYIEIVDLLKKAGAKNDSKITLDKIN